MATYISPGADGKNTIMQLVVISSKKSYEIAEALRKEGMQLHDHDVKLLNDRYTDLVEI